MATSMGGGGHGRGNQAFFHSEIDVLYSKITSTAGYRFFEAGFGFEPNSEYGDLPSFHESVGEMAALVADEGVVPEIRMNRVGASAESALSALTALSSLYSRDLDAPRIYEARFDTPVGSTYTLLPAESKRAVAQYVTVPAGRGAAKATVVHLAATVRAMLHTAMGSGVGRLAHLVQTHSSLRRATTASPGVCSPTPSPSPPTIISRRSSSSRRFTASGGRNSSIGASCGPCRISCCWARRRSRRVCTWSSGWPGTSRVARGTRRRAW